MSHERRHPKHFKRQGGPDPTAIPTLASVSGVITVGTDANGPLTFDNNAPTLPPGRQPLASNTLTIIGSTVTPGSLPEPTTSDTAEPGAEAASATKSQIPIGTVVAACVGAFIGAVIIVSAFLWWMKRSSPSRSRSANARSKQEQRRDRGRSWNKLGEDEDRWDGGGVARGGHAKVEMTETQRAADEKNFGMFKKTNSMRTTRTARALEEHGIDLPPFEFSQYHPTLAEELSLEHPEKPFAARQNSVGSWDRDTVGDDSFLSLRSVRVDSGTMSPTLAKVTPMATANGLTIHKWESAEVIHMEADTSSSSNPFADVDEERSTGGSNPFFGARDIPRGRRSRSNSRGSRHSRNTSRASRASRPASRVRPDSETNPFGDAGFPAGIPPFKPQHIPSDSVTSTGSNPYATEQAMKNLIAALNLSPEEVQERLRVASMQPSIGSRYSSISGMSATVDDDDAATVTGYPPPHNRL
ncbi:hypothetical protein BXZ70DRAFT_1024635 [Cristinia sonorae]|uniref:Uncharacterized protein n=1 Tax=Cristinia sonorae TaxID=1940300 RepID=A0A8K0UM90_9AGAR|nr:hypothetical protein BXZ70DRAFT_1024635 [Cristinia sonorae]